jgi:hypothetical protein
MLASLLLLAVVAGLARPCYAVDGYAVDGEPEPIAAIDAHTHYYDLSRPQGAPWPSKNNTLLYRTVLPAEFKALTKKHGIADAYLRQHGKVAAGKFFRKNAVGGYNLAERR